MQKTRKSKPRYLIVIARFREQLITTHDAGYSHSYARILLLKYLNRATLAGYFTVQLGPNDGKIYTEDMQLITMISIVEINYQTHL